MAFHHFLLTFLWMLYCYIHTLLACIPVKLYFEKKLKKQYRYYRLFYSLFAFITLVMLLVYQYSFQSKILIESFLIKYLAAFALVIPGLCIMLISIFKYFRLLSGVRSLYEAIPPVKLRVDGIHKFVRHPLYTGTLIFVWGLFLIFPYLSNLVAVSVISLYVVIGVKEEERKLVLQFGEAYKLYRRKVPMLVPNFRKARQ